jgi:hypothetical protein
MQKNHSSLFPSRLDAAAEVVSLARKHADQIVYIAVDTLGKEELLITLAQSLHEKIFVSLDRYQRLALCNFHVHMGLFTTEACKTRIRTIDRRSRGSSFKANSRRKRA